MSDNQNTPTKGTGALSHLPDALKDADMATLAGRYFYLIEAKEEAEGRVGRHPDGLPHLDEVEPHPHAREDLETWLHQVGFELAAITQALEDRDKHPNGAGALLPDRATDAPEDEELRRFEQAREEARKRFWKQAEKP